MNDQAAPYMTPERYAQMKRSEAAKAGHPISRLRCHTIQTRWHGNQRHSTSGSAPLMQWFWFEGDRLVSRASARSGVQSKTVSSSIAECASTIAGGATTVVLPERGDLERILSGLDDDRLGDDIQVWADLPVSCHLVILTEALSLRYWAPTDMDTSKLSEWVRALGVTSSIGKGGEIHSLIVECSVLGYRPDQASELSLAPPGVSLTALEFRLDKRGSTDEERFMCAEQIAQRWSDIERFDQFNIAQALCRGEVHRFDASGIVPADVVLPCVAGDRCRLLGNYYECDAVQVVITRISYECLGGVPVQSVHFRTTKGPLHFRPQLITICDSNNSVTEETEVKRWGSPKVSSRPLPHDGVPLDVVLAGDRISAGSTPPPASYMPC